MKKILFSFVIMRCLCFSTEIPEPYASTVLLPFDGHGWFGNANSLKQQIQLLKPKIVIEVGSWLGLSTRFIAQNLDEDAKLYAIDTWLGSPLEPLHLQDPRLPFLYQLFLSNVIHSGLCHKIIPIRMKSLEACKALNIKADLIYLDASHDTPSVSEDILNWYGHLNENGLMCGDDWSWDSVRIAVVNCAGALNKRVNHAGNFWWYD